MKVALAYNAKLPVGGYGGTERVVWWLSKGLHELGIEVTLAAAPGSTNPFGRAITPDFSRSIEFQIADVDLIHYFVSPLGKPTRPYLVTIEGNGKVGEEFFPNTVFVSRNHANRHQSDCFVYNGLDPDEYVFQSDKHKYLLFLAKASWSVKNVRGAIKLARKVSMPLHVLGGKKWFLNHWGDIHWHGILTGRRKAEFLARAMGLVFPVLWHEPFGIAVIESLVSGTPVMGSSFGSLPELIPPHVGFICHKESDFVEAVSRLSEINPIHCRDWVCEKFHYRVMAKEYLNRYERVLAGETLNPTSPKATADPRNGCTLALKEPVAK